MKWRRKLAILLVVGMLFGAASCAKDAGDAPADAENRIEIDPEEGALNTNTQKLMLYFANEDYSMLVGETAEVETPMSSRVEYSILQALIYGPRTTGMEFHAIINPQTQVIRVEEEEGALSITLSKEFLDWGFLSEPNLSAEQMNRIKQLAVYSIVNSVVEGSACRRVQILVDKEETRSGQRIARSEVGMIGNGLLEPLGRDSECMLSGQNVLGNIFEALSTKNAAVLYSYVAYMDEQQERRPLESAFTAWLQAQNASVESYSILEQVETPEEQSMVWMVNYTLNFGGGNRKVYRNIPVRLIRENSLWKISYPMLEGLF